MNRPVLVGSPESFYADDVTSTCQACGIVVFFRPHNAPHSAHVVCVGCYNDLHEPDDVEIISDATIQDLRTLVADGGGHECDEWLDGGRCQLCDRVHEHALQPLRSVRLPIGPAPAHTVVQVLVCRCGVYDLFPQCNYDLVPADIRAVFQDGMQSLGWRRVEPTS